MIFFENCICVESMDGGDPSVQRLRLFFTDTRVGGFGKAKGYFRYLRLLLFFQGHYLLS